jgi:hypothetical protein
MVVEDAGQEKIAGVRREKPIVENQEEDVATRGRIVVVKLSFKNL